MSYKEAELYSLIDRLPGKEILVVGDLILDHYIWGKVARISPEAPVVVVQVSEENKRPGGAGNVVNNLAALGVKVRLCGIVGDDENGRDLTRMLKDSGVDVSGVLVDKSRPTTVKTRVIAHAQQVVRVDREDDSPLDAALGDKLAGIVEKTLASVGGAIVSDYGKGAICASLLERLGELGARGVTGLKRPLLVDPKAPNYGLYRGATVIKPNRKEAEEACGILIRSRADAVRAGTMLLDKWGCEMVLITLGEDGMVLVSHGDKAAQSFEIDTVAQEVYDVSGAGDTVSAVFTAALAAQASPEQAAELANFGAGIAVAEVGTVAVTREDLRAAVHRRNVK